MAKTRELQELQSTLLGITAKSKELLEQTKKAADDLLSALYSANHSLQQDVRTKAALTRGDITDSQNTNTNSLDNKISQLTDMNDGMQLAQTSLSLLSEVHQSPRNTNTQTLQKTIETNLTLNAQIENKLTTLLMIVGESQNVGLEKQVAVKLTEQLTQLTKQNQELRDHLLAKRGLAVQKDAPKRTADSDVETSEKSMSKKTLGGH